MLLGNGLCIVIDPYNYIEMDRSFSETDSISRCYQDNEVAKAHDYHVWFVAHPHKLYPMHGKIPPPTGYHSGSASWFSKADRCNSSEKTDVRYILGK